MSVNKFMHPRNIYKSPPNFKELAVNFPEFKKHVKLDISGKVTFDFKDPEALRALSAILLKKDFGLEVEIPLNRLVPTIPLRLNYILWIEDLLKFISRKDNIKGIDIGTGASCVYPLLAASKNAWSMLASEVDPVSVACAKQNVARNSLDSLVKIVQVYGDELIKHLLANEDEFDFCMCNPPFFSSTQELHPFFKSRKFNRPHPKNAFVASINEVVSDGGEVEFISKLITESKSLGMKIKLYTTMVGHKSSINILKKKLRQAEVRSFQEGEFCQGNVTRWGLAWTYNNNFDLKKFSDIFKLLNKPKKTTHPLQYVLPLNEVSKSKMEASICYFLNMFKNLQMTCEEVTRNKNVHRFHVTAYSNTWSHQRQKRREKLRNGSKNVEISKELSPSTNNNCIESHQEDKFSGKRPTEERFDGSMIKKLKIATDGDDTESSIHFFKFMFAVMFIDEQISLELDLATDSDNREYLHQMLQYIKNNFRPENISKS